MLDWAQVFNWLLASSNWSGRYGLTNLLIEHLGMTFAALLIAAAIGLPIGVLIGHFGRGRALVIASTSASRAIPTMGLLFALVMLLGVEHRQFAVQCALAAIAVPPILAGAYSGIESISPATRQAPRAQGMTDFQVVRHVELPLALPSIVGGLRLAFIQVVSTVVIAPLVGLGGLGFAIVQGLALRNFTQLTASALMIVALTVVGNQLFAMLQAKSTPRLTSNEKLGPK